MFGASGCSPSLNLSGGEKPQQEQDSTNEQKQAKQNLGNARRRSGDSSESQERGNNGYYQDYGRIAHYRSG